MSDCEGGQDPACAFECGDACAGLPDCGQTLEHGESGCSVAVNCCSGGIATIVPRPCHTSEQCNNNVCSRCNSSDPVCGSAPTGEGASCLSRTCCSGGYSRLESISCDQGLTCTSNNLGKSCQRQPTGNSCTSANDCTADSCLVCTNFACVTSCTSEQTCEEGECVDNEDEDDDSECSEASDCPTDSCLECNSGGECETTCTGDEECIAGECKEPAECSESDDCEGGCCEEGECSDPECGPDYNQEGCSCTGPWRCDEACESINCPDPGICGIKSRSGTGEVSCGCMASTTGGGSPGPPGPSAPNDCNGGCSDTCGECTLTNNTFSRMCTKNICVLDKCMKAPPATVSNCVVRESCDDGDNKCPDGQCGECGWNAAQREYMQLCDVINCEAKGCIKSMQMLRPCTGVTCGSTSDCPGTKECESCRQDNTKVCSAPSCAGSGSCEVAWTVEPCESSTSGETSGTTSGPGPGPVSCSSNSQCSITGIPGESVVGECEARGPLCFRMIRSPWCNGGTCREASKEENCSCPVGPGPGPGPGTPGPGTPGPGTPGPGTPGPGTPGPGTPGPGTHFECRNNACTSVAGGGRDTCSASTPCDPLVHTECQNASCVLVNSAGDNDCTLDPNNCPVIGKHLACVGSTCTLVDGIADNTCANHSECKAGCGNKRIDQGEECDDGNLVETDGCSTSCKLAVCGDFKVDVGEECDKGLGNNGTRGTECRLNCKLQKCGDGIVDNDFGNWNEQCDDGNAIDNDECSNACKKNTCQGSRCTCTGNDCSHLECNSDDQCVSVAGAGNNTCDSSTPCDETKKHTECKNASCVVVNTAGENGCTLDPDNCPAVGKHLECRGLACEEVDGAGDNTCTDDNDCSHLECDNNACTRKAGGGLNTCDDSTSCETKKHTKCVNAACTVINSAGENGCTLDPDNCPAVGKHLECRGLACEEVDGAGDNTCTDDNDCSHLECDNNACTRKAGGGLNTCDSSTPCDETKKHTECKNASCVVVNTAGENGCTLDPDNCPAVGKHLECRGLACEEVDGAGDNTCTDDNDCSHLECDNNACTRKAGGGNNTCDSSTPCDEVKKHTECKNNSCVVVNSAGENGCTLDPDNCPVVGKHLECRGLACEEVDGAGDNTCTNDNECGHLECDNNACTRVAGTSKDTCNDSTSCKPEEEHTECKNGSCILVKTKGENGCTLDPDNCPAVEKHFKCLDDSCVEVVGSGRNECSDELRCDDPLVHTVCKDQQCITKFGPGTNTCVKSSDCPPRGSHLACNNFQCRITLGTRANTCSSDEDCSGTSSSTIIAQSSSSQTVVIIDDDEGSTGGTSSTGGATGGNNTGGATGGNNTGGATGGSDDDETLVAAASICGNGVLESPEECDDSNRRDNDGCSSTCRAEVGICGDGKVQTLLNEQCEPSSHDSTLPYDCIDCRFFSILCGNGTLDDGEECDRGPLNSDASNAKCRADCSYPRCGDGVTDDQFSEKCDDGNRLNGDGCSRQCTKEAEGNLHEAPTEIAFESQAADLGVPNTPLSPRETKVLSEFTTISVSQIEAIQAVSGPPPALGQYLANNPQLLGLFLANQTPEKVNLIAQRLGVPAVVAQQYISPQFQQQRQYPSAPYQLPFAQLRPTIQSRGPAGDTGPAAVAIVGAGAAAGLSWIRRRKK
ncbi:MAG: DUF4215 domain-containing protein [Candidatus Peribacter sp.]|nr:DUF4215 domain-containing protein [Candidatus Peribacter sp.]